MVEVVGVDGNIVTTISSPVVTSKKKHCAHNIKLNLTKHQPKDFHNELKQLFPKEDDAERIFRQFYSKNTDKDAENIPISSLINVKAKSVTKVKEKKIINNIINTVCSDSTKGNCFKYKKFFNLNDFQALKQQLDTVSKFSDRLTTDIIEKDLKIEETCKLKRQGPKKNKFHFEYNKKEFNKKYVNTYGKNMKHNLFNKTGYVVKNLSGSSVVWPFIKKEDVQHILNLENLYENIFRNNK